MSNVAEFLNTIKDAFSNPNQQIRAQKQKILDDAMAANPDAVIEIVCEQFSDVNASKTGRVTLATYLNSAIFPKEYEMSTLTWPNLQPKTKELIKVTCLKGLVEPTQTIMRAAASLLATAFTLDSMFENKWDDVLPVLSQNLDFNNVDVQNAAVTTLGYICEILNYRKVTTISDTRVDILLTGICKGLKTYGPLTETSIQAFDDSVSFLKPKLENEKICDFIMELMVSLLREVRSKHPDSEAMRKLIYCIAKISKNVYPRMAKYYGILYTEVFNCYIADELIFMACNEFFNLMLRLEVKHRTRYTENYWKNIADVCLKGLLDNKQDDSQDSSGKSLSTSILDVLGAINKLHDKEMFEVLKIFITKYIEIQDESSKSAALIAFESLIEIQNNAELIHFLSTGFFGILNLLQNGSPKLRRISSRFLLKIARNHPEVFMQDVNFQKGSSILMNMMEIPNDGDPALGTLQGHAASIFVELAKNASRSPVYSTYLRSISDHLFEVVCSTSLRTKDIYVIDSYFSIIFDFVQKVIDPKLLGQYLTSFCKFLQQVITQNVSNKEQIIEFLFIDMTVMITQIKKSEVKFFTNPQLNPAEFLNELFKTIEKIFHDGRKVISEGLMLMATILITNRSTNQQDVENFLNKYLTPALKEFQQTDTFKTAVESMSTLVKRFETGVEGYVSNIYAYFIKLLTDDVIQRELKITLFFTLSDFALHTPEVTMQHLPETIKLAEMALQAVVHFQKSDQEDLREYSDIFKETLVDFYLCVVHGIYLKYNTSDTVIENSMLRMVEFIKLTTTKELNPPVTYITNCLGLLIDFYAKKKNPNLVDLDVVKSLYHLLDKYRAQPEISGTLEYTEKYFSQL